MKKIGRISALNRRVVRQNLATSMSLLIGKERFSGVFSPEIEKYEVGDLLSYFYLCFIASVFIYYGVTLEFNIIRFIITLVAACFLFLMGKFAYLKFLIFRYFIFG